MSRHRTLPRALAGLVLGLPLAAGLMTPAAAATAPPQAPTGLVASVDPSIPWILNLSWTDNTPPSDPNAETFVEVERCQGVGCTDFVNVFFAATSGLDLTQFRDQDSGKLDNTAYSYRVRGRNDAGPSDWSNVAVATTGWRAPANPTGLTAAYVGADARGLNGDPVLTWQDNATTEFGYQVRRCDPIDCAGTLSVVDLPADTVTYRDPTAVDGQSYQYLVRALGGSGLHGFSSRIDHTAGVGLPAPLRLTATRTRTGVKLTWRNQVKQPVRVWRCDTSVCVDAGTGGYLLGTNWVVKANLKAGTSSWTDAFTPQAGTPYYYRVQVVGTAAVSHPVYVRFLG